MKAPRILFTGGGTAGHVTPNLALIERLRAAGWEVHYAGSRSGIERSLIEPLGLPYHVLPTGKLRRYLSFENLLDAFRVLAGIAAGWRLARRLKPNLVFSKGGFVSVPVVLGARLAGVPVLAHESDCTPGLATRLVAPRVAAVCTNFPDTRIAGARRVVYTGTPLRPGLLTGSRQRGLEVAGLAGAKPVLLVVGGSLGSQALNACIRGALPRLLERYDIIHICGRGNVQPTAGSAGYAQFEFVAEPYRDLLAAADLVLSRAGANGLLELIQARKPTLLVPLGTAASRGDQIENADWAARQGLARRVLEAELTEDRLLAELDGLFADRDAMQARLAAFEAPDSERMLLELIEEVAGWGPGQLAASATDQRLEEPDSK
ncbi:MAG: undecaprenyldiphospho-muramoylpentapeptide beta-N-acetylglucosaminyltransferase [Gammaproteobacteria bacterium]|nr:undecaprenyldiphospho-muramoylpentapeptide beta-N-acetylglucosaminyltransferase [Gammaproteobacteria bacterium]